MEGLKAEAPKLVSNEDSPEVQTVAYERKKIKRTSVIWNDFHEIGWDGAKQQQCKLCKFVFKASRSNSTTTLHRHLVTFLAFIGSKKKHDVLAVESKKADGGNFTMSNFNQWP